MKSPFDAAELIRSAVGGDVPSLETLLLWNYDSLLQYIDRRLNVNDKRRFDSEDVLQLAHRSAFLGIHAFNETDSHAFLKWLQVVAENSLADLRRFYNRSKRSGVREHVRIDNKSPDDSSSANNPAIQIGSSDPSPSQVAIKREDIDDLWTAIETLSSEDQELIKLKFVEQLSYREIAEQKEISEREARYRSDRALARLRGILKRANTLLDLSSNKSSADND